MTKDDRLLSLKDLRSLPIRQCPKGPIDYERQPPIVCRGEPLDPILWQGRQWAVTTYGLECRDGLYAVPAGRLTEMDWPRHLCEKNWVDPTDLKTAWLVALALHAKNLPLEVVRQAVDVDEN